MRLATWRLGDAADFRELTTDSRVVRYISNGQPWEDERTREFVARQVALEESHGYSCWRLLPSNGERLLGFCGIQPHRVFGVTEIGWWLAPDLWGRGLASEAAEAVVRFAWEQAALPRLIAVVHRENAASAGVARKLGMTLLREDELGEIPVHVFGMERPH